MLAEIDHLVDVIRADSPLSDALEGAVSRSTVVRYILRRAMNEPALQAMLAEEVTVFHAMLARRVQRVRARMRDVIKEEMFGEGDEGDESGPALPEGERVDELSSARAQRAARG